MEVILLISLVIATIGVLYFKEDRDFYEKLYEKYRDEYLKQLDEDCQRKIKLIEKETEIIELRQYIKAILLNLDKKEIVIKNHNKGYGGEIEVETNKGNATETIRLIPEKEIKKL